MEQIHKEEEMTKHKLIGRSVLGLIILATFACGETTTPGKVGTVAPTQSPTTEVTQTPSTEATESPTLEPTDTPAPPSAQIFQIGDVVNIGGFNVQVNEVFEAEGSEFNKPDEGKIFYVVDVTLENTTPEAKSVSSLMQMYLQDATAQKYEVDVMAIVAADGTSPDGEIGAGRKLRGQCGYQIPADATGLEWIFDASIWGMGQAVFKLDR
jgi:hypothetical protein